MELATQPNEHKAEIALESHRLDLPQCCPVSGNPQPGSYIVISYAPADLVLEVYALRKYINEFVGGRGDVRSMEGMIAQIAQDCRQAVGVKVKVRAYLIINPGQVMNMVVRA
jgi:NADPH-dependent 7-cyano-7-deazaguanine reductase QueF